ncbi:MAG: hypothetical protein ACI4VH_02320 [Clostridia bacterium]
MANFPFFKFPYNNYYYRYYPNYNRMNYLNKNEDVNNMNQQSDDMEDKTPNHQNSRFHEGNDSKKKSSKYNNFGPIHFASPFSLTNLEEPVLEILGIELYLDDIIILGLLFFLYKEDVQDEMLFLSLILLLLT